MDIDMEALRPFTPWTDSITCFMSEETHVHTYFYYEMEDPSVMPGIIGCRPGHPFYRQVIYNLPKATKAYPDDVMNNTGPNFLTDQYSKYMRRKISGQIDKDLKENQQGDVIKNKGNSTWMETRMERLVKEKISKIDNDIVVTHPDLFLPTYDPQAQEVVMKQCMINYQHLSAKRKELCEGPLRQQFANKPMRNSYTDHHWVHVSLWSEQKRNTDLVNVFEIVPTAKRGGEMVDAYI